MARFTFTIFILRAAMVRFTSTIFILRWLDFFPRLFTSQAAMARLSSTVVRFASRDGSFFSTSSSLCEPRWLHYLPLLFCFVAGVPLWTFFIRFCQPRWRCFNWTSLREPWRSVYFNWGCGLFTSLREPCGSLARYFFYLPVVLARLFHYLMYYDNA